MKRTLFAVLVLIAAGAAFGRQPLAPGKHLLFRPPAPSSFADSTHSFDVRHYRVDLDLPMTSGAYSGRVRIALVPRVARFDTFSLHMVDLVCDSVRRAGNPCTFTPATGRLMIDLDREFGSGESLEVDIWYHRLGSTPNRGFYWHSRQQSGFHAIGYTTTEPADARYWFPCFDEPWDKAERGCCINVTTPDSMSCAANGILDSVTTGSGKRTSWWRHDYPVPTYLMVFSASRWATFKQWFHYSPAESSYIHNFIWPEDSADAVSSFGRCVDMMDFFSDSLRYGRYPFEKYGQVEAYPFPWGGMENQTMTMVHHWWVAYGSDNGIAHEMSHMWWGDMVTCQDWREIWLNEGFATYSDELYDYHQNGRSAFLQRKASRAEDYFDEEATDPHPIWDPPFPDHLFDWGHSYCKGAWVQHMLRFVTGDTVFEQPGVFFRAMRAYGDSFKYRNANTQDYRRIMEQFTGLELGWFFDEWVYDLGYPNYDVGWQWRQTVDGYEVVVDVEQNNMSGAPGCFHLPVEVRVNWSGGSGTYRFDVAANPHREVISVPNQPTSLTFDPNDWLLDRHTVHLGIADAGAGAGPVRARIAECGPNPAAGSVRLACLLPRGGAASLRVYDANGRLVRTFFDGVQPAGTRSVAWDRTDDGGRRLGAGVYLVRLNAGSASESRKLVLTD
jgi:aminopeptidase N